MNADDVFESWKRYRVQVEVPPNFAVGVMSRLGSRRRWPGGWLRVAACLLAGAACLFRVASVLGLFLPS